MSIRWYFSSKIWLFSMNWTENSRNFIKNYQKLFYVVIDPSLIIQLIFCQIASLLRFLDFFEIFSILILNWQFLSRVDFRHQDLLLFFRIYFGPLICCSSYVNEKVYLTTLTTLKKRAHQKPPTLSFKNGFQIMKNYHSHLIRDPLAY